MHIGRINKDHEYTLSSVHDKELHKIEKTLVERELGILLSNDLKWESQTEKVNKAVKAIIAHLEYALLVWNPYLKKYSTSPLNVMRYDSSHI